MRSFQQIIVFLFALATFTFAQDTASYDATVYITSTVYKVNTVTMSGTPSGSVANSTSTISASVGTILPNYPSANGTVAPTGVNPSNTSTSAAAFTGAASQLNVNAFAAALVAGIGYLAL